MRRWFDDLVGGNEPFGVPDVVWASSVRLSTNRRLFDVPTPIEAVFEYVRAVRSHPNHVPIAPGERHLEIFEDLCIGFDATGDLSADAYVAAIALEVGASLASLDRDFARLEALDCVLPAVGQL